MNPKHPPGPPMTLANMRRQGVHHLIAYCLNDSCRHQAIIDVSRYPDDVEVRKKPPPLPFKCESAPGQNGTAGQA
jgi:hypothetical protein